GGREGIGVGGWVGLCPCNIQHRNVYDETVTRAQNCLQQHKVFHRYSLIILLSKCTRLMQLNFKMCKMFLFIKYIPLGSMPPDPPRGVISFSPFSPLTRFHAWCVCGCVGVCVLAREVV